MRSRLAAIATALGLLAPAAAVAGGPGVQATAVRQSSCCANAGSESPQAPTIDDLCCCRVRDVPAHANHSDSATLDGRANLAPPAAAMSTVQPLPLLVAPAAVTPLRARAPPPATLLAHHAALIC